MAEQNNRGSTKPLPSRTKPTGQKRSKARGVATRKKNPGKRAHKGGSSRAIESAVPDQPRRLNGAR